MHCFFCVTQGCCEGHKVDLNDDGIKDGDSIMASRNGGFGNMNDPVDGFWKVLKVINQTDPKSYRVSLFVNKSGYFQILELYTIYNFCIIIQINIFYFSATIRNFQSFSDISFSTILILESISNFSTWFIVYAVL